MGSRPHPFAGKLSLDEADEIRKLRARGLPLADLAARFGIAKSSLSRVIHLKAHAPLGVLRVALPPRDVDLLVELAGDELIPVEEFASRLLLRALRAGDW